MACINQARHGVSTGLIALAQNCPLDDRQETRPPLALLGGRFSSGYAPGQTFVPRLCETRPCRRDADELLDELVQVMSPEEDRNCAVDLVDAIPLVVHPSAKTEALGELINELPQLRIVSLVGG